MRQSNVFRFPLLNLDVACISILNHGPKMWPALSKHRPNGPKCLVGVTVYGLVIAQWLFG